MSRWQEKITQSPNQPLNQTFVGIDVGKSQLDVLTVWIKILLI